MEADVGRFLSNPLVALSAASILFLFGLLLCIAAARVFCRSRREDKAIVKIGHFEMTLTSIVGSACILAALAFAILHVDQLCPSCSQVRTAEVPPLPRARP